MTNDVFLRSSIGNDVELAPSEASGTAFTGTVIMTLAAPSVTASGVLTLPVAPQPPASGRYFVEYVKPLRPQPISGAGRVTVSAPSIEAYGFVFENEDWLLDLPSESWIMPRRATIQWYSER